MEYELKKTIKDDSFIIRVYSPILDEGERKRRMKAIYKAAENILKKVK